MLVHFGNNWIRKNSSDSQIGLGLWPGPILAVLGIFFIELFPNWTACSPITYTKQVILSGHQYNIIALVKNAHISGALIW